MNKKLILHNLIIQEEDGYSAVCLELNVASQGDTVAEAEASLREAVELYLEDVYESGDEDEFIPRPAPVDLWLKYFSIEADKLKEELKTNVEESIEFNYAVA